MDNVLVNFQSGLDKIDLQTQSKFDDKNDEIPGIFSLMEPVEGAIVGFEKPSALYDTDILYYRTLGESVSLDRQAFMGQKISGGKSKKASYPQPP